MSHATDTVRFGFIGAGAMAEALAGGLVEAGVERERLAAADPDPARQKLFAEKLGVKAKDLIKTLCRARSNVVTESATLTSPRAAIGARISISRTTLCDLVTIETGWLKRSRTARIPRVISKRCSIGW